MLITEKWFYELQKVNWSGVLRPYDFSFPAERDFICPFKKSITI
ncbi:MAG: hypothetical protein PVG14_00415 [Anaerolineales bacterium]|jgi:hypothetical protein